MVAMSMPTLPLKDDLELHQNCQPSLGRGGSFPEVLMLLTNSFSFNKHTGHCVYWPTHSWFYYFGLNAQTTLSRFLPAFSRLYPLNMNQDKD